MRTAVQAALATPGDGRAVLAVANREACQQLLGECVGPVDYAPPGAAQVGWRCGMKAGGCVCPCMHGRQGRGAAVWCGAPGLLQGTIAQHAPASPARQQRCASRPTQERRQAAAQRAAASTEHLQSLVPPVPPPPPPPALPTPASLPDTTAARPTGSPQDQRAAAAQRAEAPGEHPQELGPAGVGALFSMSEGGVTIVNWPQVCSSSCGRASCAAGSCTVAGSRPAALLHRMCAPPRPAGGDCIHCRSARWLPAGSRQHPAHAAEAPPPVSVAAGAAGDEPRHHPLHQLPAPARHGGRLGPRGVDCGVVACFAATAHREANTEIYFACLGHFQPATAIIVRWASLCAPGQLRT